MTNWYNLILLCLIIHSKVPENIFQWKYQKLSNA